MSRASELMDSRKFMTVMSDLINAWNPFDEVAASEEEKAEALQAVLDLACPEISNSETASEHQYRVKAERVNWPILKMDTVKSKPRGIKALIPVPEMTEAIDAIQSDMSKPKRKRRTKAEMSAAQDDDTRARIKKGLAKSKPFNFDTATEKQVAAHLDSLKAEQPTEDEKLRLAVREVIKPNFANRQPSPDGWRHFMVNLERHGYSLGTTGWKEALIAEGVQCNKVEFDASHISGGQLDIMIR